MSDLYAIIERAGQTKHGFSDLKRAAGEIESSLPWPASRPLVDELIASAVPQARMIGVFVLGSAAVGDPSALTQLRDHISADSDWRVQEILAHAFDRFCADTGYEAALPVIESWLQDARPNVRRACSEGLRIWTARPYFKQHPEAAIALLSARRADESDYARTSAANALRDISRKFPDLVRAELATWDVSDPHTAHARALAGKFL